MGKSSQRKGRDAEIALAKMLNDYGFPVEAGMPVNHGTTPDMVGLLGIHCEIKRVEKLNIMDAMNQAIRDSEKFGDGLPTLFHKRNYQPWLVTMRFDDWIRLYTAYWYDLGETDDGILQEHSDGILDGCGRDR